MSIDDKLRVDLRVTHRVGIREMAIALVCAHRDHNIWEDGPLRDLSRAKVLKAVKDPLYKRGHDFRDGWSVHLTDEETETIFEWATEQVRNTFPELLQDQKVEAGQ
ncbi:hypothetical protein AB0E27_31265 [Streptomyces sparsogenes]|uniref:hypothetical protein n=1 Tax=Streptomyces sparsogenes TaxID=67365 RepID=UPI0033E5EC73